MGSQHLIDVEEAIAFSNFINNSLGSDPLLERYLPLDPESQEIFERNGDGLILIKLINFVAPNSIDEHHMNTGNSLNEHMKLENLNIAIQAASKIGCQMVNITAEEVMDGKAIPTMSFFWQLIRVELLNNITIRGFPELDVLLKDGETTASLAALTPEKILVRWLNYHLRLARSELTVEDFGYNFRVFSSTSTFFQILP